MSTPKSPESGVSLVTAILTGLTPPMPDHKPDAVRQHRIDDALPTRRASTVGGQAKAGHKPSEFSSADKALIRRVHGYMAHMQLLGILNERLFCDQGECTVPYTIDQLRAEIDSVTTAVPSTGNDWGTLRKLLAKARREGVLRQINEQRINDFAVVYSLNQRQVMTLKDILLNGEDA